MCGLAAIFAYAPDAPPVDETELLAICRAMAHRGPDGEVWTLSSDGRLGMAHRRLAILDLSTDANQPMTGADGALTIVYNGEIYNFRALRAELESQGRRFSTRSDTEVLLHLYDLYGADMVHRLRGMFAFALWDGRRQGVLLARDPLGIKPLYYAGDGRILRVASQVKALRAGKHAGNSVCAAGHVGFFLYGHIPDPFTLYDDIRALPAGHTMWIDENGVHPPRAFFDVTDILARANETDPVPPLCDLVRDSVWHHLVADVPVGVFLSSGIDSATLVGMASELHGDGLKTITLAFEEFRDTPRDETPLAEEIARRYGAEHRSVRVKGRTFRETREVLLERMDQPTINGVNTFFVARAAAESGLKVALSGLGGDELLGGYDSFRRIPRLVALCGRVPGLGPIGRGLRVVTAPLARRLTSPKWAGVLEYGACISDAYLLSRALFAPWELPDLLDPDLVREGWRVLEPRARLRAAQGTISEPQRQIAALEMTFYMRHQLLRDADWAGMAHGVEIRVPFVDAWLLRDLAPVVGGGDGVNKSSLAALPSKPLPDSVVRRPKTGFSVPVREWLMGAESTGERGLRGWARHVYAAATTGS